MNTRLAQTVVFAAIASFSSVSIAQQVTFTQQQGAADAFRGTLSATGLDPSSPYIWTINGYAGHKSNTTLINECEEYPPTKEGYCDNSVTTDKRGSFSVQIQESFPPGRYKVKMLLKNPRNGYSVIWHQDPVTFNIQ